MTQYVALFLCFSLKQKSIVMHMYVSANVYRLLVPCCGSTLNKVCCEAKSKQQVSESKERKMEYLIMNV